jgi:hypothetical protein
MATNDSTSWGFAIVDTYRIRVGGHLEQRWSDCLGGMTIHLQDDGTTVLTGPLVDQSALHGVITRIRDLGLPLLSVSRVVEPQGSTK